MSIYRDDFEHQIEKADQEVFITITAGDDRHLSGFQLHTPDGIYHKGPFNGFCIGKGSSLKGKESKLTATITDTGSDTNFTSVNISLTNPHLKKTFSGSSDFDNGTVIYLITIKHI
jgi:hypothetical protein